MKDSKQPDVSSPASQSVEIAVECKSPLLSNRLSHLKQLIDEAVIQCADIENETGISFRDGRQTSLWTVRQDVFKQTLRIVDAVFESTPNPDRLKYVTEHKQMYSELEVKVRRTLTAGYQLSLEVEAAGGDSSVLVELADIGAIDLLAERSLWHTHRQRIVKLIADVAKIENRSGSEQREDVAHAADFRSVWWFGQRYTFSPTQAACVELLWTHWEQRTPTVGEPTILEHADSSSDRLRDLFDKGKHPAWGTMIVQRAKGAYELAKPERL